METNFQLLLLSPNLLKSKVPILWGLGGGEGRERQGLVETNFQLLLMSPNLLKSKVLIFGGGGGAACGNQFPTFDAESIFAKIQSSHVWWGGPHGNQFPTFVAESKFALKKKKKKKKNSAKKFSGKNVPGNGFGL